MRPFNFEEYLKNPNRELITRGGRKARIICTDRKDADYPIIVLVSNKSETGEDTLYYTEEGKFYTTGGETPFDLFFATKKREGWVNVFKGADGNSCVGDSHIFKSEEDAEKEGMTDKTYIGTTKIEWEA